MLCALCRSHLGLALYVKSYLQHTPISAKIPPTVLRVASDSQCRSVSHCVWEKQGEYIDTTSTKYGSCRAHFHQFNVIPRKMLGQIRQQFHLVRQSTGCHQAPGGLPVLPSTTASTQRNDLAASSPWPQDAISLSNSKYF